MDWLTQRSPEESLRFLQGVSRVFADVSGGPLSASLNRLVQDGNYREVVEWKFNYEDVDSVEDLRSARSIQALFSKQEEDWIGLGYDQRGSAIDAFIKAEVRCDEVNERLLLERPKGPVSVVSYLAARKISSILGDVPSLEQLHFTYGPGASTNVRSAVASHRAKLAASPVCSEDMLPCVGEFLQEFPYLAEHHCVKSPLYFPLFTEDPEEMRMYVSVQVGHGKLTFVPKNVKTERPIVIEPILNGLAQKGIGNYIKGLLKRKCNLDLKDQRVNRESAYRGSVDGSLATIDLSSASDTVSLQAVIELLPPDWVDFLGQFRTGTVEYGKTVLELSKWSSMGNAYTFELESLIFYALAVSCCEYLQLDVSEVSVFGDDIIVPQASHTLLYEVLDWFGFWVNDEKSYTSGPFRESCGADWFRGCDVRPFYLKGRPADQDLYIFHNWCLRNGYPSVASYIKAWTIPHLRIFGPNGYGDGHLLGDWNPMPNRKSRRRGWYGANFDTYQLKQKLNNNSYASDWLLPAYAAYSAAYSLSEESTPHVHNVVRGHSGYRKTSIYTLASTIF